MKIYKITHCREDEEKVCDTVELMAENETVAATIFKSIEPFQIIIKVEEIKND